MSWYSNKRLPWILIRGAFGMLGGWTLAWALGAKFIICLTVTAVPLLLTAISIVQWQAKGGSNAANGNQVPLDHTDPPN